MARSTSKAAVRYAATDVYCNFAVTVRKSRSRSKASSRCKHKAERRREKGEIKMYFVKPPDPPPILTVWMFLKDLFRVY